MRIETRMHMFYQTLLHKSQKAVIEVLKHEIINFPEVFVNEDGHSYTSKLRHITHLELYKIEAQLRIMPYNDIISWDLEHINIHTKSIINHDQVVVVSFRREHLQVMYKI